MYTTQYSNDKIKSKNKMTFMFKYADCLEGGGVDIITLGKRAL